MKRLILMWIFLWLSVGSVWSHVEANQIKVLSWNVWHAGHQNAYGDRGCEGVMGVLKGSGADVVIMVETYGASKMVADFLGFDYHLISSNLSIYSRYPIVRNYSFGDRIDTFNFGGVEIEVDGRPVRIFATWLHYLPDARLVPTHQSEDRILEWEASGTRVKEIGAILGVLEPFIAQSDSIPIIVGGDFNIHSHLDWVAQTRSMYHHNGAVVRWPVSMAMHRAGFVDSFRKANPNPAKNLGVTWLQPEPPQTDNRFDRIDYIYYLGKELDVVDSQTFDAQLGATLTMGDRQYFYASDHGFVLSTFNLGRN